MANFIDPYQKSLIVPYIAISGEGQHIGLNIEGLAIILTLNVSSLKILAVKSSLLSGGLQFK